MTARRRLAAVAWTAFLVFCVAGLHAVGGPLAPPPLTEPAALGPWLERRQPVEAAVAVIRLAALAMAWYLLAATALGLLARLSGALTLVRWADAVSVPVVRRVVSGAVSLSIAAAATGASTGTAYAAPPPAATAERGGGARATTSPPPTMRLLPSDGTDPYAPPSTPPRQVGGAPGAADGETAVSPPGASGGGPGTPAPTPAPDASATTAPPGSGPPDRSDPPDESRSGATAAATDAGEPAAEGRPGGAAAGPGGHSREIRPGGAATGPDEPPREGRPSGAATDPGGPARKGRPSGAATDPGGPARKGQPGGAATDPGGPAREGQPGGAATGPGEPGGAATDVGEPGAAPAGDRMWTVRPGDHLWALAERALAEAWGRPPTDAEVTPYWHTVVEANRARLRDPANPDLVFPGQIVALPAPPPAN